LGPTTVVCLILNRTIGSGIFVTPALVLHGMGSVGGSLLLWVFGGLISTCGLMVWLQLGLSLPLLPTGNDKMLRAVPRSGGEKNYLEFIYRKERDEPKLLVKSMYGIAFALIGNLSGNAISFGIFVMNAAGYSPAPKGPVIGLAIGILAFTVLLHMVSRRAGLFLNNVFALLKVTLLVAIIVLGFLKAGGVSLGGKPKATSNFDANESFRPGAGEVPSVTNSLVYVVYAFAGFEQPFYVLTEVRTPRKIFPRYTLRTMAFVITLFLLVNVAYFCAVPRDTPALNIQRNMAIVFFGHVFGDDNEAAKRVMAAIIAVSISGNLLVMTYTASRVKQEIAKEGILPWSLTFATSHRTPWAWWKGRHLAEDDPTLEQSPMAALVLHFFTSTLLVALTAMLEPSSAYSVLVTLYSYVINILIGFFTSLGLLYLKFKRNRNWSNPNFNPPFGWAYALVYCLACAFMLVAAFVPPSDGSPYTNAAIKLPWYVVPAIGLSVPFWGIAWYLGL
ncbi:amino acid/polyamine transporter I, partial [Microdochium bolleyi]